MSPPRCMETTTHVYHAPLIVDHDSEDDTASCAGSSYMAPRAELTQLDASGEDEKSITHSVRRRGRDSSKLKPVPILRGPIFQYGQYQGESFQTVSESHPDCYFWAKTQNRHGKFLSEYISWVKKHYMIQGEVRALQSGGNVFTATNATIRKNKTNRERLREIDKKTKK